MILGSWGGIYNCNQRVLDRALASQKTCNLSGDVVAKGDFCGVTKFDAVSFQQLKGELRAFAIFNHKFLVN
jgi:hypothetical protein